MELCLHDAVGAGLRLHSLTQFIVCANLHLKDKINILQCVVDVSGLPDKDRDRFKKRLTELSTYSSIRNMIAHDTFRTEGSGNGVEFLLVSAKRKFSLPTEVWTKDRFKKEGEKVEAFAIDWIALRDALKKSHFDYKRVTRLITILSPTHSSVVLTMPIHQDPPIRAPRNLAIPRPNRKKGGKKPPASPR